MKKNQGLSLIELVVVIAIMSVLVGVIGISVTVLSRQKVSNAASDVKGLLQTAQTIAMSKKNCYVKISQESNGIVFATYSYTAADKSDQKIIDKVTIDRKIQVLVKNPGASNFVAVSSAVEIKYNRETGSFTSDTIDAIRFKNGSKTVDLTFTKLTGKVSY